MSLHLDIVSSTLSRMNKPNRSPEAKSRRHRKVYLKRMADPTHRQKLHVRNLTRARIRSGVLVRQPCEICEATEAEAHHDDYSKPYAVRWLCPTHHREHHGLIAA